MSQDNSITIDVGQDLVREIDEALMVLNERDSSQLWTRERIAMLAIQYGLRQLLRQHPRKNVNLAGTFSKLVPEDMAGTKIRIEDISVAGIKFQTAEPQLFRKNEVLEVTFRLDDQHQTLISRKIIVSHLTGNGVGGEFCETDDAYHLVSAEAIEDYLLSESTE